MAAGSGATQEELRRHNLATLLTHVHLRGPTPRAGLTAAMGLNRSTIGALTADLAQAGLVREQPGGRAGDGRGRLGTGRPSHVVAPCAEEVAVLAVDVGVGHVRAARVGLGGVVLARGERAHRRGPHRVADLVRVTASLCDGLLAGAPAGSVCVGVGAAVPGAVARDTGVVRSAPNLGWVDQPFGARLADRLGRAVRVGNDADLGVRAEHLRGAATGSEHVVYLAGDVGVGGGVVGGGRPFGGAGGFAGEVGHLPVNPQGRHCRCGAYGCWETEVGEDALLVAAGRAAGGGLPAVREVLSAATAGEPRAAAALAGVSRWLGTGLAAVVNVLNPEVVILGGSLGEVFGAAEPAVTARFAESVLPAPRAQVRLVRPALGADATLVGAAELAFEPLLADPLATVAAAAAGEAPGRAGRGREAVRRPPP